MDELKTSKPRNSVRPSRRGHGRSLHKDPALGAHG